MLNLLFKEDTIYEKPYVAVAYGFFAVTLSLFMSMLVFKQVSSFPTIFFTAVAVAPILLSFVERDEQHHASVIQRYKKSITVFGMIFFSVAMAFAIWYAILPYEVVQNAFEFQLRALPDSAFATGDFTATQPSFTEIVRNNLGLIFAFFLLSLFYGYGSILLLVWNASVLGLMWGNTLRVFIYGSTKAAVMKSTAGIIPYLIPEAIAFFLAAIGGSILYISLTKHRNKEAVKESIKLLILSVVFILGAALIEVWMLTRV